MISVAHLLIGQAKKSLQFNHWLLLIIEIDH